MFHLLIITKKSIFYKNDIYDAYSVLLEIFDIAKEEIIIIDNYIGKVLLDELRNINKKIVVISSNIDKTLTKKYIKQYNNVTFINNDSYHDRFIICGDSFKDLGKKCFSINQFDDSEYLTRLLEKINI